MCQHWLDGTKPLPQPMLIKFPITSGFFEPWSISWHMEAETKWSPFCRQHFQSHFLEWKLLCFDSNFTGICYQGSNRRLASICLVNGLAPYRRQAINWTNAGLVHWSIYFTWSQWDFSHWLDFDIQFSDSKSECSIKVQCTSNKVDTPFVVMCFFCHNINSWRFRWLSTTPFNTLLFIIKGGKASSFITLE